MDNSSVDESAACVLTDGTDQPTPSPHAAKELGVVPTTSIETIGGDPDTALRLSFQIKVF